MKLLTLRVAVCVEDEVDRDAVMRLLATTLAEKGSEAIDSGRIHWGTAEVKVYLPQSEEHKKNRVASLKRGGYFAEIDGLRVAKKAGPR